MATALSTSPERDVVLAEVIELRQARSFVSTVARRPLDGFSASLKSGESVSIPRELANMLRQVLQAVADGKTITIGTLPEELTTTVAAQQLGVSRPTLMKMISEGEIAAHKVGTHTRLKTSDVTAFRRERLARQRAAFDELRAIEDELGEE